MIIYEIKNKINGKIYIGQHTSNELGSYWGSGKLIKHAIQKYGIDNFERTILERCFTKDELNEREKYWIKEKDSINAGYNLTEGGTGGDNSKFIDYSEEWKERQRNITKQYWDSLSESELRERSDKVSCENNGMYGKSGYWKDKKIPKEIVQKRLESRRTYEGEKNPNWKGGVSKKQCKCGKNIASNNKTCTNCIDRSGKNNPFYNKKHTEQTKQLLREYAAKREKKPSNTKKIVIYGIEYISANEAAKAFNISRSLVNYRCNSEKYDWQFKK